MSLSCSPLLRRACSALLLLFCVANQEVLASTTVIYPGPESSSGEDRRNAYVIELLGKALAQYGDKYQLREGPRGMSGIRQLHAAADRIVDVAWSLTTEEREQAMLPIRIPIDKGLIGCRLFLINKEDVIKFKAVKTVDDLRKIPLGQVHDWPDIDILRANQFNVISTSTYRGTFSMLKQKRFNYFPRSIIEIWTEKEQEEAEGLSFAIEDSLLIQYPAAYYYFVSKANPTLAHDLEEGLEMMIKNGEFDRLFNQYHGELLQKAQLNNRRIFYLKNPYLPRSAPLSRTELWLQSPR